MHYKYHDYEIGDFKILENFPAFNKSIVNEIACKFEVLSHKILLLLF